MINGRQDRSGLADVGVDEIVQGLGDGVTVVTIARIGIGRSDEPGEHAEQHQAAGERPAQRMMRSANPGARPEQQQREKYDERLRAEHVAGADVGDHAVQDDAR